MLGIVILNYNSYLDTISCVDSILSSNLDGYKIYIVDNCSKNDSFSILSEKYQDTSVLVLKSDYNGGFAYGNNFGFKRAVEDGCSLLLSTNSDVLFDADAIKIMKEFLIENDDCGIVGPLIRNIDDEIVNCNRGILTWKSHLFMKKPLCYLDIMRVKKKFHIPVDNIHPAKINGMVSGCCFMIKDDVLKEIGYLDENTFLYHEEDILSVQMQRINKAVYYLPDAKIKHLESKSVGNQKTAFVRYHNFRSAIYYLAIYQKTPKLMFFVITKMHLFALWLKGITNKEYRGYYKLLKKDIKNSKKRGVLSEKNQ